MHLGAWPTVEELAVSEGADPAMLDVVAAALAGLRGVKSTAKVSMRTEVTAAEVTGPAAAVALAEQAADDLVAAGKIVGDLRFTASDAPEIGTTADLAPVAS